MAKIHETINSLNDENASEIKEQLKAEADELDKENRRLYSRAKKAEGFEKNNEGKWVKKVEPVKSDSKEPEKPQSNEPDYAKMAFLEAKGIKHPDDQKLVQDEANRLKLPLTDILSMEHIKAKLKDVSDQREAQSGTPKGKGKSGGGASQQDVDYWLDQKNPDGTYKTPDDPDLAVKVIDARVNKEEKSSKFSDIRI